MKQAMEKKDFQLGDVIMRVVPAYTGMRITMGKPYKVIEVKNGKCITVLDNEGNPHAISNEFFHDRWVLYGATNDQLVHLLDNTTRRRNKYERGLL